MLTEAHGDKTLSRAHVFEWRKRSSVWKRMNPRSQRLQTHMTTHINDQTVHQHYYIGVLKRLVKVPLDLTWRTRIIWSQRTSSHFNE
ncbi:hypothetical protein TNCV_814201 [Trichonephila clavipes]|nr:hypothetical protein TNCV_814201 [Trichonephila clavipes]